MKIFNKMRFIALSLIILLQFIFILPGHSFAATTRVNLLTADNFAVLAGSGVTDTTPSVVIGDVGLSPTTGAAIGITSAEVTGTIYAVNAAGPGGSVNNPGLLTIAKNDLTTAYNDAAARPTTSTIATNLGGATLTDGVYHAASDTFSITGGQTLTLDGQGNADAVFIFKMGTTLVTGSSSHVVLTNGAQACNVYWQVGSSATLGTSTTIVGNIMADQSITDDGSSTVNGRLMARIAAVTLNNTHVTRQSCAAGTAGGPSLSSSSNSSSNSVCVASEITTIPIIISSRRIDADSIFISWGPFAGIDTFNVRYGLTNGNWQYNTNVTGFSTTINGLPSNQPIWIQVAARNDCAVGTYGTAVLVGGATANSGAVNPRLPNTGFGPEDNNPLNVVLPIGIIVLGSTSLLIFLKKRGLV